MTSSIFLDFPFSRRRIFVNNYLSTLFNKVTYNPSKHCFYVYVSQLTTFSLSRLQFLIDLGLHVVCRPDGEYIVVFIYL